MQSGDEDNRRPSPPSSASVGDRQPLDPDSDDNNSDNDAEPVPNTVKRKRPISVSCELCKQRKVKCDRGQPSCGWCKRNNVKCEYKERKPPGLRAGFGRFLENRSRELELRLDKMEEIVRKHSEILKTPPQPIRPGTEESSLQTEKRSLPSDHGTPSDANNPLSLSNICHAQHTDIMKPKRTFAHSTRLDTEFSTSPSTSELLHRESQPRTKLPDIPTSVQMSDVTSRPASQGTGSHSDLEDLPPYKLLYSLVDLYFKHVNTWCPILHRKTTLDNLFGISDMREEDRILLHAIVATTLRFSTDPRLTHERRQHYHRVSKQKVLLYGMENSSVKSLLALVILALDLCGSNGPPGWNIMALITRSVVQLGLAVETTSFSVAPHYTSIYTLRVMVLPDPKDFIDEEARRRLFWMVYVLDRYATIATAFEFALDDKEIDRKLPCRDDLWMENRKVETRWFATSNHHDDGDGGREDQLGKTENLGAFAHYIEILGILSKIHQFLKQPVDISRLRDVEQWQLRYKELDKELTSWNRGLPGEFGDMTKLFQPGSRTLNCNWIMLYAAYHTALIRLHSSAAYPTTRSHIFAPSFSASQRCRSSVESITAIGEFVVNNGFLPKLGPPFAFTIWVAARVLLVHGSTVEHRLSSQISFFVDTLREMGRYWPVAGRYHELLQSVLDEYRDSERQGEGATPNSVKILADMRRTAFDLDFLISRQPRNGAPCISRHGSLTPRTPAPNELEYLDVFNFFNVPRLPFDEENDTPRTSTGLGQLQCLPNEFNITNFMIDVSSDWL